MSIIVVDYTELYFAAVAGRPVPPVVAGKFVQVRNEVFLHVVFSPKEFTKYHAHIVERFCMDRGIEGTWDARKERYDITDRSWEIVGGGKFERDADRKVLRLSGDSMAYGRFDERGLMEALASLPHLSGFKISID